MAGREPDAPADTKPPRAARALNTLAFAAVAVAVGLVAAAATPAVLRTTAGVGAPAPADILSLPPPPNFRAPGLPPADEHPDFLDDDEADPRSDLERQFPDVPWPGDADRQRELDARRGRKTEGQARVEAGADVRFGTARHNLLLLAEPGDVAHTLGVVKADERVMVVKEVDGWVLLVHGGTTSGGQVGMGWAKKSEIAIR